MLQPSRDFFTRFSNKTSTAAGHPLTSVIAFATIVIWAVSGPLFGFSDTWQLVINTGTTIVTFLMVFLIQNTQNRDGKAVQLKLDELIRATKGAHLVLLDMEELSEQELQKIRKRYIELAEKARERKKNGEPDDDDNASVELD